MADRKRDLAILGSVAAAALLVFFGLKKPATRESGARGAVPATSFLAISVDVQGLRGSPLLGAIFGKNRAFGVDTLTDACGFDPLTRIEELDVAVPEGGEAGDFGVAASGAMTDEELAQCAEKVLASRGSVAVVEKRGGFTRVSDEHGARLAFHTGGPFLVGRGEWLEAMIDTAERRRASIAENAVHARLRRSLESDGKKSLVVGTAILPQALRDRLKKEMGADATGAEGAEAMAGVLGVSAAGLAVRVLGVASEAILEAELELTCETPDACAEVAKLIERKRVGWSKDLAVRLLGLGPPIDALKVETRGATLTASTHARVDDVSAALNRVLTPRGTGREPRAIPPQNLPKSPPPDEVLRPPGRHEDAGPSISKGAR